MSSALKPVISQPGGGPQPTPVPGQLNKPSAPSVYGQPPLVALHAAQQPNHAAPNAHPTNHYSLNVPNAAQHFASPSLPPPAAITNNSPKTSTSYQPNLGQPPNVSASQSPPEPDKPQSNGTPEPVPAQAPALLAPTAEIQQNHVSAPKEPKPNTVLQQQEKEKESEKSKPEVAEQAEKIHTPEVARTDAVGVVPVSSSENSSAENKPEPEPAAVPVAVDSTIENAKKDDEDESMEADRTDETVTATTPKKEQPLVSTPKSSTKPARAVRKVKPTKPEELSRKSSTSSQKSPSSGSSKSKRTRIRTQPYQCPLPEIDIIRKISTRTPRTRNADDKLIIFYKNEFLAVRNQEGSFYVCQAMQNIYKSSPRIKIRWLSQDKGDKNGEIYAPDFYDQTDFDCILTNLELQRVDKGKFKLPAAEKERTDSILKRALAVEKGDATPPSLTEEHPDGLDLSLYKEESQLKKRRAQKRKSSKTRKTSKSPEGAKVRRVAVKGAGKAPSRAVATTSKKAADAKKSSTSAARSERAKRRSDSSSTKSSPVVDHKKAKVLAKIGRKSAMAAARSHSIKTSAAIAAAAAVSAKSSKSGSSSTKPQKVVASTSQAAVRKTKRTKK